MGVEDTSYQITDLNANTTFYDWVVKENTEIIEKLNLLGVYGVAGSTGIDISSPTGGTHTFSLADTISGVTVSGDLIVTGTITGAPVISVNGQTGAVVIALTGDTGEKGATGAVGTGPHKFTHDNQITNGNFDVWQRGLSFGATGEAYLADRWVFKSDNPGAIERRIFDRKTFTKGQTDVKGNPTYYANLDLEFNATKASTDHHAIENRIEGQSKFIGETITLDGYIRVNVNAAGASLSPFIRRTAIDGSFTTIEPFGTVIAGNSNWTYFNAYKDVSVAGHTGATSDGYVSVGFTFGTTGGSSADIDFANIRLFSSQGSTLTDAPYFEETDPKVELQKCSRYYQRSYDLDTLTGSNTMIDSIRPTYDPFRFIAPPNTDRVYLDFDVEMRETPTVSIYSPASGVLGEGYNGSSNLDMRLSSGTTGYGGTRIHTTGADTLRIFPNPKGLGVLPESGFVIFDEIFFNFVADSDYDI